MLRVSEHRKKVRERKLKASHFKETVVPPVPAPTVVARNKCALLKKLSLLLHHFCFLKRNGTFFEFF
jgi:hypothetical protein